MLTHRLWLAASCLALMLMGGAVSMVVQEGEPQDRFMQAEELFRKGNYQQAAEIFKKLSIDPKVESKIAADSLTQLVACKGMLQLLGDFDADVKAAVESRPKDRKMLQTAANLLTSTAHIGLVADQKFTRGHSERQGGVHISTVEQDRLQAVKWFLAAIRIAKESGVEETSEEFGLMHLQLASALQLGRNYQESWTLQALTDLEATPDYLDLDSQTNTPRRYAPAAEDKPVLHYQPESFEAAKSDGERWRWALERAKAAPATKWLATQAWAEFLQSQFSTNTLQQGWWRHERSGSEDGMDQKSAIAVIHTLEDNETIAKLSTGYQRFRLEDEFNPIVQYKLLAANENAGVATYALWVLHNTYLNRRQYPQAAEYLRQSIERFGDDQFQTKKNQYENIVKPRVKIDPIPNQPPGKPAEFSILFRNAKKVTFTASKVDVEKMLAVTKANWRKTEGNFGLSISPETAVSAKVAEWKQDLEPRENHWDRRITIQSPIDKPGIYLIEANVDDGAHKARALLWMNDLSITRRPGDGKQLYFVNDAVTGKPVSGATVEFIGLGVEPMADGRSQVDRQNFARKSDALGMVEVELKQNYNWLAVARTAGGSAAILGLEQLWSHVFNSPVQGGLKCYGVSDRPMYRPGEKVKAKFWLRQVTFGDVEPSQHSEQKVLIELNSQQGVKVISKEATTDRFGACEVELEVPQSAGLGRFYFTVSGTYSSLAIRVEEYRKPEFEVKILAPEKPVALGETIDARIQAKYYFGSPVTNAEVTVRVTRSTYTDSFYPMGRFDWCYGPGYWWWAREYDWYPGWSIWHGCFPSPDPWWPRFQEPSELVLEKQVQLDSSGEAKVSIDTAAAKAIYGDADHEYQISVEVRDASRRTLTAEGRVIAARDPFRIYSWVHRGYYNVGEKIVANFQARTLDGTSIQASGQVDLLRITYDAEGKPTEQVITSLPAKTDEQGEFRQVFEATRAGQYRVRLKLKDAAGREVEGGYIFTVRGRGAAGDDFRYNALELTTDKREYAVGEKVKLLVAADRDDAQVYLFVKPRVAYTVPQLVVLKEKSSVVEIEVTAADQPNFFVEAFTVYDGEVHQAQREVFVPPSDRVLNVQLTANKETYLPGEEAEVELTVTDSAGKPVSVSCLINAYDRSLEQIAADVLPEDIRKFFWAMRNQHFPTQRSSLDIIGNPIEINGVSPMAPLGQFGASQADDFDAGVGKNGRSMANRAKGRRGGMGAPGDGMAFAMAERGMMDAAPMSSAMGMGAYQTGAYGMAGAGGMMGAGNDSVGPKPTVRKDFADSALWLAKVTTDKNGRAKAKFKLPDNLTTWRIGGWAVGTRTEVGSVDIRAVTRRDLLVRLQTPRFLVERDEAILSAIVNNDYPTDKQVRVKLSIDGETSLERLADSAVEQTVLVKSRGQARVDWRCRAIAEGNVKLQVSAIADNASDAVEQSLPIVVHGFLKTDSFAGTVRRDAESSKVKIVVPAERREEQSEIVVRVSPTLAMAMMDALPYLADYPYGCTEQTLNRFLPTVLTQRVLIERKIDLAKLKEARNNLNAQELGDPAERRARWKHGESDPVYDAAKVAEMVDVGVGRLTNMQHADGGWGWFSGAEEVSEAHTTAVVVRGLQIAAQNEVAIVPDVLQRGVAWLVRYQGTVLEELKNPNTKVKHVSDIDALVFHVLSMADQADPEYQKFLFEKRASLSVYGKCLLAWATHKLGNAEQTKTLRENIEQFLVEDAENETAYLRDDTPWWYWYGSQIEASAMYLKLLSAQDPNSTVAPRLVKYLLNNRKHATYWHSTRDTALVVEAFADYLKVTGEAEANVTAEVLLNGKRLGSVEFTPENLFTVNNTISIRGNAIPAGEHQLEIRRTGNGPLYWNAFSTNFTLEEEIKPTGLEVKVERRFYSLTPIEKDLKLPDANAAVVDTKQAGFKRVLLKDTDEVPSGQLVEVELLIESKNDYEYLLLEDNKAACLEAVDTQSGYFYSAGLQIYRELRDQKVGLCIRWLPRGKYSVRYQLRTEAPGKFTALPAKITGMYAPELVGNSADFDVGVIDR